MQTGSQVTSGIVPAQRQPGVQLFRAGVGPAGRCVGYVSWEPWGLCWQASPPCLVPHSRHRWSYCPPRAFPASPLIVVAAHCWPLGSGCCGACYCQWRWTRSPGHPLAVRVLGAGLGEVVVWEAEGAPRDGLGPPCECLTEKAWVQS